MGMSQSTISRIETGKVEPEVDTIARIVRATRGAVTAADLIPPKLRELLERAGK